MVNVMVLSSFPMLSLVSKEYHFEHFPLKYPANCWIETINAVHKNVKRITKILKLFTILARGPI